MWLLLQVRDCIARWRPELEEQWFPHLYPLASEPAQYSASHLSQVVFFVLTVVAVAGLLAFIADRVLRAREPSRGNVRTNPAWFDSLDVTYRPPNTDVIVAVELKTNAMVHGGIQGYESKPDQTLAWLVLKEHSVIPFVVRKTDGTLEPIGKQWRYVFISGDEIRSVNATFAPAEWPGLSKSKSLLRRIFDKATVVVVNVLKRGSAILRGT